MSCVKVTSPSLIVPVKLLASATNVDDWFSSSLSVVQLVAKVALRVKMPLVKFCFHVCNSCLFVYKYSLFVSFGTML
jgi:hypothetical protein